MKIVEKIPYFILAGLAYLILYSSCANQGSPSGGPRDSIPPVLIKTEPEFGQLNFKGDEIRLTFNEYVKNDKIMELMVVSPPLEKRPTIKMKSKTLILAFNEDLHDSVTYSIDFKNSIEDNNEGNPIESMRFAFSTCDVFDTLRVAGAVKNAETLDPAIGTLVMLYKNLNDTAVSKQIPDYIAKTNDEGIFLIGNIAPGKYKIYTINDANSDMKYNEGVEEIAFYDSLVVPRVHFVEDPDTLVSGADSLLISGHYHFTPEPIYLRQFMEDVFSQFLTSAERLTRNKCRFIFEESVADTFGISLLNRELDNWYILEPNPGMDTIDMWVTDTLAANIDSMQLELNYNQLDSAGNIYVKKDTVDMVYIEEELDVPSRKRRNNKDEEEEEKTKPIPQFSISDNIKSNGFDLNKSIFFTMPQPVKSFDFNLVHLYEQEDTTGTPLKFKLKKDTTAWRKYHLSYAWAPDTEYRIEVDSAACENIFGITNKKVSKKFRIQKDDYYGAIYITAKNVEGNIILQLLSGDGEKRVSEKEINSDGVTVFDFLDPGKYIIKAIYDDNKNGEWDTGSFIDHIQPEKVAYFQKVIKVKSHWDHKEPWDLSIDPTYPKDLFDQDLEDKKKEEAKQKRLEGNKSRNSSSGFGSGGSSGGIRNVIKR